MLRSSLLRSRITVQSHRYGLTAGKPRAMAASSSTTAKSEWIAILPDFEDKGLERRLSVRPQHLENIGPRIESGFWKMGGAILHEEAKEGEPLKFRGSVMLGLASSREEFVNTLKDDVYFKNQVWDWDKVQIYPFKTGFRIPP